MSSASSVFLAFPTIAGDTPESVSGAVAQLKAFGPVTLAVIAGAGLSQSTVEQFAQTGADAVIVATHSGLESHRIEAAVDAAAHLIAQVGTRLVVGHHGSASTEVMSRLAIREGFALSLDTSGISADSQSVTTRHEVFGGDWKTEWSFSGPSAVVITLRPQPGELQGSSAPVDTVSVESAKTDRWPRLVSSEPRSHTGARPKLERARVVVSGGRGVGSEEGFTQVAALADRLGAAVGASRAAVDSGYAPKNLQVGQTGLSVSPEVYIAVGISGAIQHKAGMQNSHFIVTVNKVEHAPLNEIADIAVVGDLFDFLPLLVEELG